MKNSNVFKAKMKLGAGEMAQQEHLLLFHRIRAQFPAPMPGSSQLSLTAAGVGAGSCASGLQGTYTHRYILNADTQLHLIKKQKNKSLKRTAKIKLIQTKTNTDTVCCRTLKSVLGNVIL